VQSILRGVDGRFIPGSVVNQIAGDFDYAIARMRAEQAEPGAITLTITKARRYSDDSLDEIRNALRRYLGNGLKIQVVFEESGSDLPLSQRPPPLSSPVDLQSQRGLRIAH
jgi:phenylacetate-CoA ligase